MSKSTLEAGFNNPLACSTEEKQYEILHGITYSRQQLDPTHAFARAALGVKLSYIDWTLKSTDAEWWLLDQPELHLEEHIVFPDLVGWKPERFESLPEDKVIDTKPDWVCEVLTSSSEEKDRSIKMPLYAELGIQNLWLIDPSSKSMETYQLENQRWNLVATLTGDVNVNQTPFDSITFSLINLWSGE